MDEQDPAEQEQIAAQEQRIKDTKNYLAGLDIVFGVENTERNEQEVKEIKENANIAAERQLGESIGQLVLLNEQIAKEIKVRLGDKKAKELLGIYKTEVEEKMLNNGIRVSEEALKQREDAKEQLFLTKNLKYVTFS